MRYDKLLTQLDRARTAYEDTVRGLLANAAKEDAQVAEALKSISKKKHWTQLPKNRAKVKAAVRKMKAAKGKR